MLLGTFGCIYSYKSVFSSFPDTYPGVELLDHLIVPVLVFWEPSMRFCTVTAPIYIPHQQRTGVPFSPTSFPTFVICKLFNDSHSYRCDTTAHCWFDLHLSNNQQYWASFHVPVSHPYVFFGKISIQVFCPFLLGYLCFDFELYELFIYFKILTLRSLSFVNIFSLSIGCIFVLLMVSFAE